MTLIVSLCKAEVKWKQYSQRWNILYCITIRF